MQQKDWPETPLSQQKGKRNGIKTPKTRYVTHQQHWLPSSHVYIILRCTKSTLKIKTASRFVQYLISYITTLLTLTQQPQQYRGSTFPESADHIPLSVSHEGSVRATKAGCERKTKKNTVVSSLSPSSAACEQGQG